jgi:hypothetical protein
MSETITSIKKSSGNCKIYFISTTSEPWYRNKLRNKIPGILRAICALFKKRQMPPGWMFTDVLRETPRSGQSPNLSSETLRQQ